METNFETVRRNLSNYAAIGASVIALAGAELAADAEHVRAAGQESASASSAGFKPGHYEGVTSQTCLPVAADKGLCKEDQKIPISFTVTSNEIKGLKTAVIDGCRGDIGTTTDIALPVHPKAGKLREGVFMISQDIHYGLVRNVTQGVVKRNRANGKIVSTAGINSQGELDPSGDGICQSGILTWHATRK